VDVLPVAIRSAMAVSRGPHLDVTIKMGSAKHSRQWAMSFGIPVETNVALSRAIRHNWNHQFIFKVVVGATIDQLEIE